jgi:hypothetical protein
MIFRITKATFLFKHSKFSYLKVIKYAKQHIFTELRYIVDNVTSLPHSSEKDEPKNWYLLTQLYCNYKE